jgi:hypothetical protein
MQPRHDQQTADVPTPPAAAGGVVVTTAVALIEAAALTAAMRRMASWNPSMHLYAAADRAWAPSGAEGRAGWRTDPSGQAADFRIAVLLAEAAISRCLADGGYLSARQLSVDLRHAAAWLAAGAPARR